MLLRVLIGAACVAVIVVSGIWLTQQFYPEYAAWKQRREEAAWEASDTGRCARLIQADEQYQRTGNVTALPMKFAEFDAAVRKCRGLPPR